MPSFADHHCHLLSYAAGAKLPDDLRSHHHHLADSGSSPTDSPPPTEIGELEDAFRDALSDARGLGLGMITEAGMTDWAHYDALRSLRDQGDLPVEVRLLIASGLADLSRMHGGGDDQLGIIGVKFYADGYLGLRTAALREPYADEPETSGVLFCTAEELARRAGPFASAGFAIATHAIGDAAIETVLDAYELIFGRDCAAAAPRIEHAQVLTPQLIARIADMGVVVCLQPSFAVSDAAMARAALGDDRYATAYRWDLLLSAGGRVVSGSDYPVETLDPAVGMEHLATGENQDGQAVAHGLGRDLAQAIMTARDPFGV